MPSSACAPRKETCSPLARRPTTHSFTLPRSPVRAGSHRGHTAGRPGLRLQVNACVRAQERTSASATISPRWHPRSPTSVSQTHPDAPHPDARTLTEPQPSYRVWQLGRPGSKVNHLLGGVHGAKATAREVAGAETTRTARVSGCKGRAGFSLESRRSIGSLS